MGSFEPRVITHQKIELETCSNPLKMGKVLQFSRKKIVSVLDVVFFLCLHDERMFMYILLTFG